MKTEYFTEGRKVFMTSGEIAGHVGEFNTAEQAEEYVMVMNKIQNGQFKVTLVGPNEDEVINKLKEENKRLKEFIKVIL